MTGGRRQTGFQNPDLRYDTTVEVIDWRRGRIVASQRFDDYYLAWPEPGLTGRVAVKPDGSVRYVTYRVELERVRPRPRPAEIAARSNAFPHPGGPGMTRFNRRNGRAALGTWRRPASRRLFALPAVVATGIWAASPGVATQEAPDATVLEPCRARCGIALVPDGEYGEDSGDGMIETTMARSWKDASGRLYLVGMSSNHILVFGPDGSFLGRVGREGAGPGEFEILGSLALIEDGIFSVTDQGLGRIQTFDWTGKLLRGVQPQGWQPIGSYTVHVGGSLAVHAADIRSPAQVGYPLHLIDLDKGTVVESFGSLTGELPLGGHVEPRTIAPGPGRAVWAARHFTAYEFELWEPNTLLRTLRRDAEWFPSISIDEVGAHGRRPTPTVGQIAADDSLLWAVVFTAGDRWAEADEHRDPDLRYDTTVEVIDWRRGRIVASQRFNGFYGGWPEPGLTGRVVVKPDGSVRYVTYRVELERHGR